MASGIAHDFNNAISPILGFSELLLMRPENLPEDSQEKLKTIFACAQDAASVVSRLREFYRHRAPDEFRQPICPNQLMDQTIAMTRPRWKDQAMQQGKTITVETDFRAGDVFYGSEAEIRELLTNLVFNAVDAITADGVLTLRTHSTTNEVRFEVADTGIGMAEDVRLKCLEPFFTTKGDQGTGMGLSMVFGIVERHGGRIDIESERGKGTTIQISLPVGQGPDGVEESAVEALRSERSLHVLIVDDEQPIRDIIAQLLTLDGHTSETAADGLEGLDLFHPGRFDVILTDRGMPGMNGDQLAASIRRVDPNQPILMLTGFGDMMAATREEPPGIDMVISKPINRQKLQDAMESVAQLSLEAIST
ncbi:MAG: response regulator [Planctomycetota bacterium]|nr:response regulator [Planctomycetota bacterium]